MPNVNAGSFYAEYKGHPLELCENIHSTLSVADSRPCIFLAGDSSLDNKHWYFDGFASKKNQLKRSPPPHFVAPALNGFETLLSPPRMVKDVAYFVNKELSEHPPDQPAPYCLNLSVEESTVGERTETLKSPTPSLLPHDEFVKARATAGDTVILSVGGNDVALKPTKMTIASVFLLTRTPLWALKFLGPWSPGWGHLEDLFHSQIQAMLDNLLSSPSPPSRVLVCMIYFLDETPGDSWADTVLERLGYDADPEKLQYIIRALYERIKDKGFRAPDSGATRIETFPLFEVLDGKDSSDYEQRVEPSVQGSEKMAKAFVGHLFPKNKR